MTARKKYYKNKYGAKKKKTYGGYPSQNYSGPSYYAFHDIDMHKEEIDYNIRSEGMENYKFVISNPSIKMGRVNAPGYPNGKKLRIFKSGNYNLLDAIVMTVDNSENLVNEYGICINPKDAKTGGYDWNWDIAQVEIGG